MKLEELQKEFIDFIYNNKKPLHLFSDIEAASVQESLDIYRTNSRFALIDSVKLTFHSTYLILGHKKFEKLTSQYVKDNYSLSGNLDLYGLSFPEFLQASGVKPHYVVDMASLDREHLICFNSPDYEYLPIDAFRAINQEDYENLVFQLNPTSKVCELGYNVLDYWKYLRDTGKPKAQHKISQKNNCVIVGRNSNNYIFAMPLSRVETQFIDLCKRQKKLFEIFEELSSIDPNFNLQQILQKFINEQVIASFTLN